MVDTPNGDPVIPEAPSPDVKPVATPVVNAVDPAEVERLRKDKEKSDLRIRQLENEATARAKADDEAKAKDLEEQSKFKELYESEKSAKEELLTEKQTAEKQTAVKAEADKVLADFPDEVKALASDLGVALTDDSEEAIADYKTKLESAAKRVGAKVTPNNPSAPQAPGKVTGPALRELMADPVKWDAYMRENYSTTAAMMTPRRTT